MLCGAWLVYQPAMPGFFLLDDFDNLSALEGGVTDWAAFSHYLDIGNAGPLGRPIAKTSFLLNDFAWPSNPGGFKYVNLMIHLLCGVFIFALLRALLGLWVEGRASDWLALLATAIWLLHPAQVSTVMYVVQRMTQLASLFVVLGALAHVHLRMAKGVSERTRFVLLATSLCCFTLLAAYSKESGVLLPVYVLVLEATILSAIPASRLIRAGTFAGLVVPTMILVAYIAYLPRWAPGYGSRDYGLWERLLTQPVVLFDYLWHLVSLQVHGMGLFHDDYQVRSSLLDPVVITALTGIVVALTFAMKYRRRYPVAAFAVLWFLAGHLLESTTVNLELYFEHRNYLPYLGPIVGALVVIHRLLKRAGPDVPKFAPLFGMMMVGLSAFVTYGYAHEWGSRARLIPVWAAQHPDSPRAQRTYAHFLAGAGLPGAALDELDGAYERFPEDLSIPVISIDISCAFNLPLRFDIERLAESVAQHKWTDGLRPAFDSLLNRTDQSCPEYASELHALVQRLPTLKGAQFRQGGIASVFVLDGELYLRQGQPMGALGSFQQVDRMKPSVSSALRLADLFLLTGNFDIARKALDVAQEREGRAKEQLSLERRQQYESKRTMIDQMESRLIERDGANRAVP